ncbi:MAG: DUF4062 domain-containing protein [Chloroflexota bacterium]|nr:DUF4062 domain-containing protein [Chloroflexota bacterium]
MPYQAMVFEILQAGPGDVFEERRAIAEAIETWTQRHGYQMGVVMRPVMWETDTYPELGGDPQAIINKQLAGRCDAVIAVFATRLGTGTPRAPSGTAEEIERFHSQGKPVAIYFSEGSADLTRLDAVQFQALQDYRRALKDRGMYRSYRSIPDLRRLIDQHLVALGYSLQAPLQAEEPQQVGAATIFEPTETDMRVLATLGRVVVATGYNKAHSLSLPEAPELAGISMDDIFESIRVLRVQGLTTIDDPSYHRWEVGLTSDGLEMWLLNFVPNYDQQQRQIAAAVAEDDIRDPTDVANKTGIPSIVVEHVLQRWAARKLVILNRLYNGTRIDRISSEIRCLAQSSAASDRTDATAASRRDAMDRGPRYRTVARLIGVDVVALSDFGGEIGDPVAAAVKVDGWTVVQVLAPALRRSWHQNTEEHFRDEVRRLAQTHHLLGRRGPVRLMFDPPQESTETRDEAGGEPVDRG